MDIEKAVVECGTEAVLRYRTIVVSLEARIERLHDAFGNMYVGHREHSGDGQWQWCFASASAGEGGRSYQGAPRR